MREDAVAPVIAAMLVLAVIVTFFAVWNASVIPAMKEQAEVSHLHDVEEGMLRFSSDIESAASAPSDMILSERLPLGGGDVLYSAARSGGALAVQDEGEYLGIRLYNGSSRAEWRGNLSNISYQPVGNFWLDQGYDWSRGYVNVTKGNESVPLEYPAMKDVPYKIADVLFSASVRSYGTDPGTCSVIVIKSVNITPSKTGGSMSGNGIGTLALNSMANPEEPYYNITEIQVNTSLGVPLSPGFSQAMHDAVNTSLNKSLVSACSNIQYGGDPTNRTIMLRVVDPLSNITVIRQTTDITLGTQ
ncbi:MAG: hypothetical protein LUQ31_10885 [Methanoregula sp.]|nr:hypothetical protein [Methanoregula sp.]